ncbi:Tetratricopeptide repeat-containing protein [Cyclobacterium xiamenense]|uniref:Tetratricopeptide repeat-containing protein n=1 Tax=Cyclobacterium xiamenense TaxID=1297121 RepID=A0A1H6VWX1_9BACT|nr:tetratricopeptide repeat protein [Cyclobacterium xiamenense]SEJ05120.1 Tetratricopeptide repeat-containing protein [Cyclobacterium xiamenense]
MKRSQIIFVVAGLLLIYFLYSLPLVVVDNDQEQGMAGTESSLGSDVNPDATSHGGSLNAADQEMIEKLMAEMEGEPDDENFVIFADSIGRVYEKSGKLDSAAYYFGLIAEKVPGPENWEKAGNQYYEAFGFAMEEEKTRRLAERARFYLGKVLEASPERLDLKTKVAMTYVSSSNPMQGITMLRDILEQDPDNEEALFNMGILSMQSGQYKRAVERFERLVANHPDNIQGQFYLGVSLFESDQRSRAKTQLESLRELTDDPQILSGIENYLDRL